MKVMMLINSFSGGGGEKVFVNLANNWAMRKRTKLNIIYVVGCPVGPNKSELNSDIKVEKISNKLGTLSILLKSYRILLFLHKHKPNVVFSTLELSNVLNVICTSVYNFFTGSHIKIITREANTLTGLDVQSNSKMATKSASGRLLDVVYTKLISKVDFVIANSFDTMNDVVAYRGVEENKISAISNPVLKTRVSPEIAKYHERNDNSVRIISIGRLTEQKNYFFTLSLISHLRRVGVNAFLDIYGEGELRDEIEAKIVELGLVGYVKLRGFSHDISYKMHSYDVFLIASFWEGFGNVIVEALSCGLPVVSSNCPGGPKDIITNDSLGVLCQLNIEDFSNGIIFQLKADSLERRRFRIEHSNKFVSEVISNRYYEIIKGIVNE